MVEIRIFGGVGEIGGNKILVEDDDSRIFLDFGMSFGKMGEFFQDFSKPRTNSALRDLLRLGILPRLDGIYRADACRLDGIDEVLAAHEGFEDLWTAPVESYAAYQAKHGRPFVDGVVLSHAHLDHFGHFGYLDPAIPIHSTPVTATMLRAIERVSSTSGMEGEVTVTSRRVVGRNSKGNHPGAMKIEKEKDGSEVVEIPRPLHSQAPYTPFKVGAFKVTLIPVDHSVPGAASALIETRDGKRIYYTGDVRFHGSFHETTKRLRDTVRGLAPDVMLCEGTRITSDEVDDEEHVRAGLGATVKATRGLAMVDFGWKDTSRFETVQKVAAAAGRELVVGHKLAYLARQLDGVEGASVTSLEKYGNVRVYRRRIKSALYSNADYDALEHGYWDG
ncbi:MAG TPA: MBL fold metallo-hydrolase, partial [Candidatus Thermoplasmatota archaeon]|nr:MBL fold metallo-hydrolase [Candidatus Thermoplasmatota archaeon]